MCFEVPNTLRNVLDDIWSHKNDFEKIEKKSFFSVDLTLESELSSFAPAFFLTGRELF